MSRQPRTAHRAADRPGTSPGLRKRLGSYLRPRQGEEVDSLGIPWRIYYWIVIYSAFSMTTTPLLQSFTKGGAELADTYIRVMCALGYLGIPVYYWFAKRRSYAYSRGFFNFVLFYGTTATILPCIELDVVPAAVLGSLLLAPIGAAFMLPRRAALGQLGYAVVSSSLVIGIFQSEAAIIRGVMLEIVMVGTALMVLAMKGHLSAVLAANREMSERDPLTGAANLRRYGQRVMDEIARHDRGGDSFELVAVDLDDFKQVNDQLSHTMGDQVLIRSAEAMQRQLHESDLLVRRGGDEFLILLAKVPGRETSDVLCRIREDVAFTRREICPEIIPTATTVPVMRELGETAQELLQKADDALHEVKVHVPSTRRGTATADDVRNIITSVGDRTSRLKDLAPEDLEAEAHKRVLENPRAGGFKVAFRTASLTTAAFGIAGIMGGTTGIDGLSMSVRQTLLSIFLIAVMTPAFWWFSSRPRQSIKAQQGLGAMSVVTVTIGCFVAGRASAAAADMYLVSMFVMCALMPMRVAITLSLVLFGVYSGFVIDGFEMAEMRLWNMASVVFIICGVLVMLRSGTRQAAKANAELASEDKLTGLPNLRRLRERLEDELRRANATERRFCLIMLDLDDFKSVNDTYSHTIGDQTLVAVAEAISKTSRPTDMPARRGGDEFAIVLDEARVGEIEPIVERVTSAISATRSAIVPLVATTASIGWVASKPGDDVDSLLARVDQALHERKVESHARRGLLDENDSNVVQLRSA